VTRRFETPVPGPDDMRAFGESLAAVMEPGDLVVLTGDLGAGKTTLTQGIGAGLGVTGDVLSPTFVIARVHRGGRIPLVHADAYRLQSVDEIDDLDLDASLAESVTVVEWGAGLVERLSGDRLEVQIERPTDAVDETRIVTLHPVGERWVSRIGVRQIGQAIDENPPLD
jgi:tRNA threonylcarbamoyladenosine biosynthesis protein TsaE